MQRAQVLFQVREIDPTYSMVHAAKEKRPFLQIKSCSQFKKINLAVPGLCCGLQNLVVAACRIFSCGTWVYFTNQGLKAPALGVWSLNHWTTREVSTFTGLG